MQTLSTLNTRCLWLPLAAMYVCTRCYTFEIHFITAWQPGRLIGVSGQQLNLNEI